MPSLLRPPPSSAWNWLSADPRLARCCLGLVVGDREMGMTGFRCRPAVTLALAPCGGVGALLFTVLGAPLFLGMHRLMAG